MDTKKKIDVVDCVSEEDDLQIVKITRRVQVPDAEDFLRRFSRGGPSGPFGPGGSNYGQSESVKPLLRICEAPREKGDLPLPLPGTEGANTSASEVTVWYSGHPDPRLTSQANQNPRDRISERKPNPAKEQSARAVNPRLRSSPTGSPSSPAHRRGETTNQEPGRVEEALLADPYHIPRRLGRPRPLHPPNRRSTYRANRNRASRNGRQPSGSQFEELAARVREVTYNPPNRQRPTIQLNTAQSIVAHRRHERAQRSINKKRRIRCPLCPKLVNGQADLTRHLRGTHKAKVGASKAFRCELCMVGCSSQTQLNDHIAGDKHEQLVRNSLNDRDRRLLSRIN